jgi:signal transduction histidine kinase
MAVELDTQVAVIQSASREVTERQRLHIMEVPHLATFLHALSDFLVVVNAERQIVFANRSLLTFLDQPDAARVRGRRLGEVLNCVHAFETSGGCGTTETCQTCGAFQAMQAAQQGRPAVEECRILRRTHDALELRVSSTPLATGGEHLSIIAAHDISHEKRRRALERIFFHDLLNTAGALWGYASLLQAGEPEQADELKDGVYHLSRRLIDEIQAQRDLAAAESAELVPVTEEFDALELVRETLDIFARHEVAQGRVLRLDPAAQAALLASDRLLVGRVLGNMVKNALEACRPGEVVTAGTRPCEDTVEFWIHNPTYMPRMVQLQIFQRSFTTKGAGRGLGTFSMKLLTETYLHGRVWFDSSPETGTTFWAVYPREWAGESPKSAPA